MAIAGRPAARTLKTKQAPPGKDSRASRATKKAYAKMAKAGRNGFKK